MIKSCDPNQVAYGIKQAEAIVKTCENLMAINKSVLPHDVMLKKAFKNFLSNPHHKPAEVQEFFYKVCDQLSGDVKIDHDTIDKIVPALRNHINGIPNDQALPAYEREHVITRAYGRCAGCGKMVKKLTVDHIIAKKYVGNCLGEDNLQALCSHCNNTKGIGMNWRNIARRAFENEPEYVLENAELSFDEVVKIISRDRMAI